MYKRYCTGLPYISPATRLHIYRVVTHGIIIILCSKCTKFPPMASDSKALGGIYSYKQPMYPFTIIIHLKCLLVFFGPPISLETIFLTVTSLSIGDPRNKHSTNETPTGIVCGRAS